MCGRFALSAKTKDLEKLLPNFYINTKLIPRFNIAPTQKISAVLNDGSNELKEVKWGLIPFWSKDEKIGNTMINARAETLSEKQMFKNLLMKKRCIIFASGFYEWKKIEGTKKKIPYFIKLKQDKIIALAGLWDSWKSPTGEAINSATIITTEANELMSDIHNRMPVILNYDSIPLWLETGSVDINELKSLLKPYTSSEMDFYEITSRVNNPIYDDSDCIAPASELFN